jgi:LacI family transcriptional regulator
MNKQVDVMQGAGRPTMKDVASKAGVALKTVSRVVNGEAGVTVTTADRVRDAITDLGFRRNESARLLRTGQTATLGFITRDWSDPDHASVYRGIEEVARSNGYLLYSGSTDLDPEREERLALAMCARRVDGLIVIPTPGSHDYLVSEIEAGVAAVFVLAPSPWADGLGRTADTALSADSVLPVDTVLPDERGGGRAAVSHLIARGHRRIGLVAGDPATHRAAELLAGYADAMMGAGLSADPAWTTLTAQQLPRAPVTAVLCADRAQTKAALRARANGSDRERPAIVGFGDLALADLVSPPVSVLSYDSVLIGRTAGELLIRRLAGAQSPPRTVHVPVRLISR